MTGYTNHLQMTIFLRIDGRMKVYHTRSIDQIMEELKNRHPYEVTLVDGIKYSAEFADKIATKIDGQKLHDDAVEKIRLIRKVSVLVYYGNR